MSRAARKTQHSSPGTGSHIDLKAAHTPLYTRAGYIEGGNIQVDNT